MIAVIEIGGKQYKVKEKDVLKTEKIEGKAEEKISFNKVLLVSRDDEIKIGKPLLPNAKVEARILEQGKGKKIKVIKFKPKVRYHKKIGHRQPYTKVIIEKIIIS